MNLLKYKRYKRVFYAGIAVVVLDVLVLFTAMALNLPETYNMAIVIAVLCSAVVGGILVLTGSVNTAKCRAWDIKDVYNNVKKYSILPYCKAVDYGQEIEIIRENYQKDSSEDKNRINADDFRKNRLAKKSADTENFFDFKVLQSGKIYYGFYINCFLGLHTLSDANKYGIIKILYSTDNYFDANPEQLGDVADKLFLCESEDFDVNKFYSDPFIFNMKLPEKITGGKEVYLTSVIAERRQLPLGYLSHNVIPIIASPGKSPSAFVADCRYWSDNFISRYAFWNDGDKFTAYNTERIASFSERECIDYALELKNIREKFLADEANRPVDFLGEDPFPSYANSDAQFYYAYIINGQKNIFKDRPCTGIYSTEDYFKSAPQELKAIADRLANDKEIKKNTDGVVNSRRHEISAYKLPYDITDGREVYAAAIFVSKEKLPVLSLTDNLLPVVCYTGNEGDWLYVADSQYWSDGFTYQFVNGNKRQ